MKNAARTNYRFSKTARRLTVALSLAGMAGIASATPVTWSSNGHEYEVITSGSISWDASRAQAQAMGAGWDLATITSIEEQNFITGLIGPANGSLQEYYIGGLYQNGSWTWVTGEAFTFTYWGNGEPNGNINEPRLALDGRYNTPNWGWNDYTGAGSSFVMGFVAERTQAVPEPSTFGLLAFGLLGLGYRFRKRGRLKRGDN